MSPFRYSTIYFCRNLNKSSKTQRPSSSKNLHYRWFLLILPLNWPWNIFLDCNTKAEAAHIFPRLNLLAQDHAYSYNSTCFWNLEKGIKLYKSYTLECPIWPLQWKWGFGPVLKIAFAKIPCNLQFEFWNASFSLSTFVVTS